MPSKTLRRELGHPDIKHGTYVTYMNYKCRCEPCVDDYRRYKTAYRERNREKIAAQQHAYYIANRERLLEAGRAAAASPEGRMRRKAQKFGLTVDQLAALLAGDECAICGTTEPGKHGWHIDHDHRCCPANGSSCGKCIRGILCHKCNVGLGHFNDDPSRLAAAIDYVGGAMP